MTLRTLLGVLVELNQGLQKHGYHLLSADQLEPLLFDDHRGRCLDHLHILAEVCDAQCECHQRFNATQLTSGQSNVVLFVANGNESLLEDEIVMGCAEPNLIGG